MSRRWDAPRGGNDGYQTSSHRSVYA